MKQVKPFNKRVLKQLYKENKTIYKSSGIKKMFRCGKFNKNNYMGGDDIIRDFFYMFENGKIEDNVKVFLDDCIINIFVDIKCINDQRYARITMSNAKEQSPTINTYLFSWYKNRGRTEVAELNGKQMTEKQYIELLNILALGWNYFDNYVTKLKERIEKE